MAAIQGHDIGMCAHGDSSASQYRRSSPYTPPFAIIYLSFLPNRIGTPDHVKPKRGYGGAMSPDSAMVYLG